MQFKQLIALAYAITAAAVAIQLMSAYTQTVQQQFAQKTIVPTLMPEPTPTNPVVMMSRQVPLGQKLSASDLKLVLWPASIAPKGAFRSIEDVFAARPEQFSKAALVEGEVLLDSKLSATGEGSSLSMM